MQVNYSPGDGHSHHPQNEARQTRQLPFNPAFHTIKPGRADTIEQWSQDKKCAPRVGLWWLPVCPICVSGYHPQSILQAGLRDLSTPPMPGTFYRNVGDGSKTWLFSEQETTLPHYWKTPTGNLPAFRNRFQNGSFRVIGKCCFAHGGGIFAKQKHRGPNTFSVWPPVLLLVELSGLEPPTYALRTRRSPD